MIAEVCAQRCHVEVPLVPPVVMAIVAMRFEKRFDGIEEEGGGLRSHGCSYANSKPVTAPVLKVAPLPTTNEPIKTGMKSWK